MAEEKKESAAKAFFVKHGEKVGLGAAALALVAYLVVGVLMAKDDPTPKQVDREVRRIKDDKVTSHDKDAEFKAPDSKPWSDTAVKPWNNVVASARGGTDWVATGLPEFKLKEIAPVAIKIRGVRIPEIAFGNVEVSLDSVILTWSVKAFTPAEERTLARDNDILKLKEFVIERQAAVGGKWEEIGRVTDLKTTTFKDTKIDPKTKYTYRVTSIPEPDKLNRPEAKGMTVTGSAVSTYGIWKVSFINPSKAAGSAKGMVYVTIEKFEKGRGTVSIRRIHYAGDKIGSWAETEGAEPTSTHVVSQGGKSFKVDFNTGMELVSIEPAKVTIDIVKCKTQFDNTGNKIGCTELKEKRSFDVHEIVYKDDDGTHKMHSPNPKDSPRGQDEKCEDHGGKKIVAVLPQPKATDPTTEAPKVDPAALKAQKRETDAEKLFKDAEKAEAAKNKAQAISLYEKLLLDFADTDFVSKGKKTAIEERLAALKAK